jgi:Integrase core domain
MGSMGAVGSAYDNALMESFFGSMQIELLDRHTWATRADLASAIFECIEAFYNPVRRHSALGYLSHRPRTPAQPHRDSGMINQPKPSGTAGTGHLRPPGAWLQPWGPAARARSPSRPPRGCGERSGSPRAVSVVAGSSMTVLVARVVLDAGANAEPWGHVRLV